MTEIINVPQAIKNILLEKTLIFDFFNERII